MTRSPPKDGKSISLNYLISLEEKLGQAMAYANIAKSEREGRGKVRSHGVNRGSSGRNIFTPINYSEEIIRAMELEKDSLAVGGRRDVLKNFQRQISLNELRGIYNEVRKVSTKDLKDNKLNVLVTLKTVFEKIEKENQEKIEKGRKDTDEASMFAGLNRSMLGKRNRREMDLNSTPFESKPIEPQPPLKRQKTSENWWDAFAVSTTTFLGNFGINLPQPEIKEQAVKVDTTSPQVARFMGSSSSKENAPPPSSKKQDRPYFFINSLECEKQLNSSELMNNPNHYLFKRKAMWNKYLGQLGINNESIETNSVLGEATLSYIQFLKTNIKELKYKNDNAKILSGFLQLELKKIEYMFLGEKIIPESNGPRPFQQNEPRIYRDPQSSWLSPKANEAYKALKGVGANIAHSTGIDRISGLIGDEKYEHDDRDSSPIWHSQSPVSHKMYEATHKVKSKMFSEISSESQQTILVCRYLVGQIKAPGEATGKFLDEIKLPNRIPDSLTGNYKQRIQQELSSKIGSSSYSNSRPEPTPKSTPTPTLEKANSLNNLKVGSRPPHISQHALLKRSDSLPVTPSNSPKPYQRDEIEKVLTKIRSKKFSSNDLVKAVDSNLDLSGGMFKRASEIDKAIGVMDQEYNLSQVNSLVQELKDYKQSFGHQSRDSGFEFHGRSGENAYTYIRFLGSRIKLLQEVSKHLEFSKPDLKKSSLLREIATDNEKLQDHKSQLESIKKMQANLFLELARFEVGLTPKGNFNTGEIFGFKQKTTTTSGTPNPLGPIHVEPQVQLQKRKTKEEILERELCSHIASNRLGINYSLDYTVLVTNPTENPVRKELREVIESSRLLMRESSLKGRAR
jgi:hypothetical protein